MKSNLEVNDTLILIDNNNVYTHSTAALRVGQQLSFPYSWLSNFFLLVPTFLRDFVYNIIGKNRYRCVGALPLTKSIQNRLMGKMDHCVIPPNNIKERFLD
jgi:predicted DCC family thiol-disulfide oxidoreductase YuxK